MTSEAPSGSTAQPTTPAEPTEKDHAAARKRADGILGVPYYGDTDMRRSEFEDAQQSARCYLAARAEITVDDALLERRAQFIVMGSPGFRC